MPLPNQYFINIGQLYPFNGSVLRELYRARTKVCVWSLSLDPIDSIDQPLSITVGRNIVGRDSAIQPVPLYTAISVITSQVRQRR